MPVSIPTETYDLAAFALLLVVGLTLTIMIGVRLAYRNKYHSVSVPYRSFFYNLMTENAWPHTVLYFLILLAVIAAVVLICSS
jgi:hypothetical protein